MTMVDTTHKPSHLARGDMQDVVRRVLLSYGKKDIYATVDEIAGKSGLLYPQANQTLYRLRNLGQLEFIKEDDNPRSPVIGFSLIKMPSSDTAHERTVAETPVVPKIKSTPVHLLEYMNRKLAVERARKELLAAKVDPENVLFEPDPLGEEAIQLFAELTETKQSMVMIENDLIAERRNAAYYKEQLEARSATETFNDSGT